VATSRTFRCRIVTPLESVLDEDVTYVTLPAWDGQKGVMAGAASFLTALGLGSMRLDFASGGSRWYLLEGGFAQLQHAAPDGNESGDILTLLTDRAIPAEKLSVTDAEKELDAALNDSVVGDREPLERRQNFARAKVTMAKAIRERGI